MNCEILHTLYLKSNGEFLCNDDFGENIVLGQISEPIERFDIESLFKNNQYAIIRQSFSSGIPPWGNVCEKCAFFRSEEPYRDFLRYKEIRKFQIEPSLACNLSCPACSNAHQVKTRKKPFLMETSYFEAVLISLKRNNYLLNEIEYCGQGEPLMHPDFSKLVDISRSIFPKTRQRLITNGNFDYKQTTGCRFIDDIYVSCDGVRQGSYQQYRVRGNVDKALRFMRDVPAEIDGKKQRLIWKYILFEFNDSDEEILEAQRLAQDLEVDNLLFVITHSQFRSTRFTLESLATLPIEHSNVLVNAHPSFYDGVYRGKLHRGLIKLPQLKKSSYRCYLDEVSLFPGGKLFLQGWASGITKVDLVKVYLNSAYLGEAKPSSKRPDIKAAFHNYNCESAGFRFSSLVENDSYNSKAQIRLELFVDEMQVGVTESRYSWALVNESFDDSFDDS